MTVGVDGINRGRMTCKGVVVLMCILPFMTHANNFSRTPHATKPSGAANLFRNSPFNTHPAGSSILDGHERNSEEDIVDEGDFYPDTTAPHSDDDSSASTSEDAFAPPPDFYRPNASDRAAGGTVQERVDEWREKVATNADKYTNSVRDDQGRVKLLTSIGKSSRALVFFLFIWRDVYLYELASNASSALFRMLFTFPLALMFLLNLAGFVVSFGNSGKKRLKAILNLDKLVELLLMEYAFFRLTLLPSRTVSRDVYMGSLIHSVAFLVQAHGLTRFSWDESSAVPLANYHDAYQRTAAQHQQQQRPFAAGNGLYMGQQQPNRPPGVY